MILVCAWRLFNPVYIDQSSTCKDKLRKTVSTWFFKKPLCQ